MPFVKSLLLYREEKRLVRLYRSLSRNAKTRIMTLVDLAARADTAARQ